ncbi:hypothetical protein KUV65_17580 [Maritalea mobilis]|uniref:DUF6634 family protein n=1 Tax=Maritalea mobilis TaxID=483324 RepID=UPI001C97E86D|nr:DUF6634 family protein [Maritalea mobilis]MBY6203184.1 hypothetical protein [Maritalea mobilis]
MVEAAAAVLTGPTQEDLAAAPTLHDWAFAISGIGNLCLDATGVTGHPHLPEDEAVFTSALVFLDPARGLARTSSRWYRLGKHRENEGRFRPEMADVQAFLNAQLVLLDAARPAFEGR